MYCKLCGAENAEDAELCQNCGSDLNQELEGFALTESAHLLPAFEEGPPIHITDKGKTYGTVGFIIGFLSLLIPIASGCSFCGCGATLTPFFGPLASIFASFLPLIFILLNITAAIVGLVFSVDGKNRSKKCGYKNKKGTTGIVFSTIALVLSCICLIVTIIAAFVPTFATLLVGFITAAVGVAGAIIGFITAVFGFIAGVLTGDPSFFSDKIGQFISF